MNDDAAIHVELDAAYQLPEGTRILKVTPPLYRYSIRCWTQSRLVEDDRCVEITANGLDVSQLPTVADAELFARLKEHERAQQAALVEATPPPPTYRRTVRVPGDNASRLDLIVGQSDPNGVTLAPHWGWFAFHVPSPVMAGSLSAHVEMQGDWDSMPVRLYYAFGIELLRTSL